MDSPLTHLIISRLLIAEVCRILITAINNQVLYFFENNRHEVHYFSHQFKRYHLAFSPEKKKEYIKDYDAILLSKYDSAEKRF